MIILEEINSKLLGFFAMRNSSYFSTYRCSYQHLVLVYFESKNLCFITYLKYNMVRLNEEKVEVFFLGQTNRNYHGTKIIQRIFSR